MAKRSSVTIAVFKLIRRHSALASAVLCAFDLLELDGQDLRPKPIEERKRLLAKLLNGSQDREATVCTASRRFLPFERTPEVSNAIFDKPALVKPAPSKHCHGVSIAILPRQAAPGHRRDRR
jgi:hypothetical protein